MNYKGSKNFINLPFYAFDQTESLLNFWESQNFNFDEITEVGYSVTDPKASGFNIRKKKKIRRDLNDIVYVRLISALEVFLIDLIKDGFLRSKQPRLLGKPFL